jgi:hypothetical protein
MCPEPSAPIVANVHALDESASAHSAGNFQSQQEQAMPRGDKSSYSSRQKRKAAHIEEGYEKRGVSKKTAAKRAWATVNKQEGGGTKKGSGRKKTATRKKTAAKKSARKTTRRKSATKRARSR